MTKAKWCGIIASVRNRNHFKEVITLKYAKLRGAIRERLGSEGVLAVKLGMNPVTLSKKLNGKTDWKKNEIERTLEYLVIPRSEVYDYFFSN